MATTTYVLMTATTFCFFVLLLVSRTDGYQIRNYFSLCEILKLKTSYQSLFHSALPSFTEHPGLRWGEINFYDNEYGFPVMPVNACNIGEEIIIIEREKFNIAVAGQLWNHVEEHCLFFEESWSHTIQFDPLFKGSSTVVNPATTGNQLSYSIDHEPSDVETPTLLRFHI